MEYPSLISSQKASDSGLQIHLHPLVLLTVSDLITRHTLRCQPGPIVGGLLGQQHGRNITLEYAFECPVEQQNNGTVALNESWFADRLQQYKDVHRAPALELMGWFTTTPVTGPETQHIPIHRQIMDSYNETAVLLAFHPSEVLKGASIGGKLPLTIYETIYESVQSFVKGQEQEDDGDRRMELDGQEGPLDLRFREVPYSVETGEAEMISVDFVARGGGNATSIDTSPKKASNGQASQEAVGEVSAQEAGSHKEAKALNDSSTLSSEDEELIASLTARANAVRMLHTRLQLIKSYLTHLPPSYLNSSSNPRTPHTEINHPILRSIQALVNRLPLLLPADLDAFEQERMAEKSDVALVELLGSLANSITEVAEMGRKFAIVEGKRRTKRSKAGGTGAGGGGPFGSNFVDIGGIAGNVEHAVPVGR
ncbi:MAG: hypothetical protein Q9167_004108 [Letrouitia subvulpina]